MKPTSIPSTLARTTRSRLVAVTSQTGSTPAIAVPTTLPSAPIPKASGMVTTATATQAIALAVMTRPRCGTRVKVVRPLRWLHSPVTDRIAMIGRMTVIGMPIAAANVL